MTIIYSFLFCGLVCLIGQLFLDYTKLTPGHLTPSFAVLGALLGFFDIYDKIINFVGAGATTPIINFGNSLFTAALMGFKTNGLLGIFSNMFATSSCIISCTVIFSFIFTLFSYPKD